MAHQAAAQSTQVYTGDFSTVFPNPERGYHNRYELVTDPNVNIYVTPASPAGYSADEEDTSFSRAIADGDTLIHSYIHLDMWTTTAALPQEFIDSLNQGFANIRAAHLKTIVRFAYVWDSYPSVDISIMLQHIQQVGPVLTANADVIEHLEAGFLGMWGEWHDCAYCDWFQEPEAIQRYQLIEALLRNTAAITPIAIRYPLNYKEFVFPSTIDSNGNIASTGVPDCQGALPDNCTLSQQEKDRLGFHDDCFLSDSADMGTYDNNSWMGWYDVPTKRSWMYSMLTSFGTYKEAGGETCDSNGNDTVSESQLEMSELHYTEINQDYAPVNVSFWQSTNVPAQGIDPAETVFTRFQRKLGYRFRLVDATFPTSTTAGGNFTFSADISNDGYGGLIHQRPVFLVFDNGSNRYNVQLTGIDPRQWLASSLSYQGVANTTSIPTQTLRLPTGMAGGSYRLSLWLPDPSANLQTIPNYSIRLANVGTWDSSTGLNVLATGVQINNCSSSCTPPTPPTLLLGSVTNSTVALAWSGATDPVGVTGYYVFRNGMQIAAVTGTSYTDIGLASGTQYSYTVEAYDVAGNVSTPSNTVTVTTPLPATPPAPTLSSANVTASSVTLSWTTVNDSNGGITYTVNRGSAQVVSGSTAATYTDSGLTPSTQYSYTVQAVDAAGHASPPSNAVTVTTAAPALSCHIDYVVQSDWGTGFNAVVNLTNTGATAINGWTLTWTWAGNQTITSAYGINSWNQGGPSVTFSAPPGFWDAAIAPGQTLSYDIGLSASYSGTNTSPTVFLINGTACQ
jgi:chitodextrinase